jgi:hypothetical protein
MNYVSVTSPGSDMSKPIFNYFDDYLISLGEPTTSPGWNIRTLQNHMDNIIKEKPSESNLYIDSGGFQIIVDDIPEGRIQEYINCYHNICKNNINNIDKIFSLDIYNRNLSGDDIYKYNINSINQSIDLIKEQPSFADKQLFVLQTSNKYSFANWEKMMKEVQVEKYFKNWSIGGLVGLKKTTNEKFSHAVPATLWLLTYQKKYNATINQIHWLGQSSRLSFLAMRLFEKLYGLNMTSDSSQLVRFAPLEQKLPYMFKENDEFVLIREQDDVFKKMALTHSWKDYDKRIKTRPPRNDEKTSNGAEVKEKFDIYGYFKQTGRLHNVDFIEFQAQNVYYEIQFANYIVDKIMDIGIENIDSEDALKGLHPIMCQGRVSKELFNNIKYFNDFKNIVETADLDQATSIMEAIVESYDERSIKKGLEGIAKDISILTSESLGFKEIVIQNEQEILNLNIDKTRIDSIENYFKSYNQILLDYDDSIEIEKIKIKQEKKKVQQYNNDKVSEHIHELLKIDSNRHLEMNELKKSARSNLKSILLKPNIKQYNDMINAIQNAKNDYICNCKEQVSNLKLEKDTYSEILEKFNIYEDARLNAKQQYDERIIKIEELNKQKELFK